jgi:hypothetical protein
MYFAELSVVLLLLAFPTLNQPIRHIIEKQYIIVGNGAYPDDSVLS